MSKRKVYKLCSNWYIDMDPENKGWEKGWNSSVSDTAVRTKVPSIIQETFPGRHGVAFYWCQFIPEIQRENTDRLYLCIGAADYKADVFLNGIYLGSHEGGETPFSFDVTDVVWLDKENLLSVRIVNPGIEDIDGMNIVNIPNRNKAPGHIAGSCTNHGGLWGSVELVCLPAVYINDVFMIGDIHSGMLTVKLNLQNTRETEVSAVVSVNVYGRYGANEKIVGKEEYISVAAGHMEKELSLVVPDVKLWDVDDPNLYKIEICLNSDYGNHKKIETFGFREFWVKDGFFYLNDRKIFVKSSHTGNAFPVGQGYPAIKEQIRKDMIMAKAYGFNMIRAIAGMLRTEQLEIADEIGLMIYEESFAAWNLGHGPFLPGNGHDRVGNEEKMLERFDNSVIEMIRRDRNHPCITIWGLLNEMPGNCPVTKRASDFLPKLRKEDPTRLVFFDSGRWDHYADTASASNPYSDTWDVAMGGDLACDKDVWMGNVGDLHNYPNYPLTDAFINGVRNYASGYKPAFFSETGMSSIFNVIEEAKHYEQYGYRSDLEDYVLIKSQADKLEKDWERLGLNKIFPYPEMMLKESQRMSAGDRRRIFNAIRSNPMFNGYNLTGLLDHGWCGEGLWSLWRRFKPEVYDVVCDGWAPLRFCLFVKSHVYSGEEFEIEAVLANECVLPVGTYVADFAITGDEGTIQMWSEHFVIEDDVFAVPVMKKKINLAVKSGKYSLTAYMKEASPLGNKLDFWLTDRNDITTDAEITCCGIRETTVEFLRNKGVAIKEFCGNDSGLILAGDVNGDEILTLKEAAQKGAVVLFVDYRAFSDEKSDNLRLLNIADDIELKKILEWLYHKESVMANEKIFRGLGRGLMNQEIFGRVISSRYFETRMTPDDVICPAFYTGHYASEGSYNCVHNALGVNCGNGKIYLSAFEVEENLGIEPAAERLLINFIEYLK